MSVSLGKTIKAARLKNGRTQEEVGKRLCVSQAQLSRIEKDQVEPDPDLLKDIQTFIHESGIEVNGDDIDYMPTDMSEKDIPQSDGITPATMEIPQQKAGVLAFDFKKDFGRFFYFFLIVLSFITMDIGPLFAWYAVYYSIGHKYHKAIIIVNIIWAVVLTLMVINLYYFTIFPVNIKVIDVS